MTTLDDRAEHAIVMFILINERLTSTNRLKKPLFANCGSWNYQTSLVWGSCGVRSVHSMDRPWGRQR